MLVERDAVVAATDPCAPIPFWIRVGGRAHVHGVGRTAVTHRYPHAAGAGANETVAADASAASALSRGDRVAPVELILDPVVVGGTTRHGFVRYPLRRRADMGAGS